MHISSTTTSTKATYDVPILLLASSDVEGTIHSRKFVARPSHYQELVITARRIFGIKDASLVFGTSTLDVCRGAWIEIEESAYEPLLECLDEVIVRPGAPHENVIDGDPTAVTVRDKTREVNRVADSNLIHKNVSNIVSEGRREPQPDASASGLSRNSTLAPSVPARNEPRTRDEAPATTQPSSPRLRSKFPPIPEAPFDVHETPKLTKSRLLTQLDELSQPEPKPLSYPRQRTLEPEVEVQEKPKSKFRPARQIQPESEPALLVHEPPRARQTRLKREPQPEPEPEVVEEDEESGKEDEDREPPSDAKTEEVSDRGRKKDVVEYEEDDDFWRFGTKSVGPTTTSSRTQQESVLPPTNPRANSMATRKGTIIDVEVKKEPEEKKGKIRDARARLSIVNATQLPRASGRSLSHYQQGPEVRFRVTVHGPHTGQSADFRTRGGHNIRKVLESVCRTFELPFERSRLVLEDASWGTQYYYCDPEDTIGSCGIDADSQLFVQVDGMTYENLSQSSEEEDED
ncbi:hypothetical protein H2248_004386 [Termitomyces sp. 'cryptogamus']|nr:hypothetical protein H2248_004386 [Termitomyces sp. 'cryptogamus']